MKPDIFGPGKTRQMVMNAIAEQSNFEQGVAPQDAHEEIKQHFEKLRRSFKQHFPRKRKK